MSMTGAPAAFTVYRQDIMPDGTPVEKIAFEEKMEAVSTRFGGPGVQMVRNSMRRILIGAIRAGQVSNNDLLVLQEYLDDVGLGRDVAVARLERDHEKTV